MPRQTPMHWGPRCPGGEGAWCPPQTPVQWWGHRSPTSTPSRGVSLPEVPMAVAWMPAHSPRARVPQVGGSLFWTFDRGTRPGLPPLPSLLPYSGGRPDTSATADPAVGTDRPTSIPSSPTVVSPSLWGQVSSSPLFCPTVPGTLSLLCSEARQVGWLPIGPGPHSGPRLWRGVSREGGERTICSVVVLMLESMDCSSVLQRTESSRNIQCGGS